MRDTGPVARGTATNSGPLSPIDEAQSAREAGRLWMTKISCVRTCSKRVRKHVRSQQSIRRPNVGSSRLGREIEEHNRTHIPFRSWCKFCVSARAPNLPHRARCHPHHDQSAIKNEIAADYCFLRDVSGGPSQPVLVGRDRRTGMFSLCPCGPLQRSWS